MLAQIFLSCCAAVPLISPVNVVLGPSSTMFPFATGPSFAACANNSPSAGGAELPVKHVPPKKATASEPNGIRWRKLGHDSLRFLAVMHAFRWATEAGTRSGGIGLDSSYLRAAGNLHGWADGDPFYVNYIGHPIQGAVAGRLLSINDPRYYRTEFGRSRDYWKGKLRATAFAWAFSEQFEIGPLSEASIGHIQSSFPQQGFVDHVITPVMGLGWMVGEDAIDRYLIQRVEDQTANRWIRMALRTGLNPTRSFANVMDGRAPWDRGSRAGILSYKPEPPSADTPASRFDGSEITNTKPAPFEFSTSPGWRTFAGNSCMGGGAEAAYRLNPELQLVLAVNGCKLLGLPTDVSGDALVYQIGPRWTPAPTGKWSPYAHVLIGGMKVTHEQLYPEKKIAVEEANQGSPASLENSLHDQYTSQEESSGLAVSAGTGVDYKLNDALAFRVASIEYSRSNLGRVGGLSYNNGLQVSTGIVLRLGTW